MGFEFPACRFARRYALRCTGTMGLPRATEGSEWEYIVLEND